MRARAFIRCLLVAVACVAVPGAASTQPFASAPLEALLSRAPTSASTEARVITLSAVFLGVPYVLDPAGEGPDGLVDRDPTMPLDRMDCQTYVETVLALARARHADEVWPELRAIRYRDGLVSFERRHHFPEVDWIPANVARGVLREVTADVAGPHGLSVASTRITRPAWFRALATSPTQARNDHLRRAPLARRELERIAAESQETMGTVLYVGKAALADPEVVTRIPNGAVVLVVRPRTNLYGRVGSRQNIAHMGFAVRTPDGLMYRHASSTRRRAVIDRPFSEYLHAMAKTKTFAGLAVFVVQPRQTQG